MSTAYRLTSWILAVSGCWLAGVTAAEPKPDAGEAELTVKIAKPIGDEGDFVVALFTKPDGFPIDLRKADQRAVVTRKESRHTFTRLAKGEYVVLVVQDRNRNGQLDRNALGIPNEPIGLSNYPRIDPKQGRPDFEKAKVTVDDQATVEITLTEILRPGR